MAASREQAQVAASSSADNMQAVREEWYELNFGHFFDLCRTAYSNGDYNQRRVYTGKEGRHVQVPEHLGR